jgi:hypothetical protein
VAVHQFSDGSPHKEDKIVAVKARFGELIHHVKGTDWVKDGASLNCDQSKNSLLVQSLVISYCQGLRLHEWWLVTVVVDNRRLRGREVAAHGVEAEKARSRAKRSDPT